MNRAERRRLEREVGKNVSEALINVKKQASSEAIDTAFIAMLALPMLVMRDKYGFGKVRLERFMDQVIDLYESFNAGYLTLEDMHKSLEDEAGIKIHKD